MLTTKQRSVLRSKANTLKPTIFIGKEGLTEKVLNQLDFELFVHELVKVSILQSCTLPAKELLQICSEKLSAQPVCAIGKKFVLYKFSEKENFNHIPLE
ncbi:MAG: YhbY family RNA-binding protein [Clostridia bacterium]|nr:YhbY family RNA-binding protein [Clostridia bacterium]